GLDERGPAALVPDELHGLRAAFGLQIGDGDRRAGRGEGQRDGTAEAGASAGDDSAAWEQRYHAHFRNSSTADAATSGASWISMGPPGSTDNAAPLMRRCHSSAYGNGFTRSVSPHTTSVGATMRCRRLRMPLSGIGQTNRAIAERRWTDSICAA